MPCYVQRGILSLHQMTAASHSTVLMETPFVKFQTWNATPLILPFTESSKTVRPLLRYSHDSLFILMLHHFRLLFNQFPCRFNAHSNRSRPRWVKPICIFALPLTWRQWSSRSKSAMDQLSHTSGWSRLLPLEFTLFSLPSSFETACCTPTGSASTTSFSDSVPDSLWCCLLATKNSVRNCICIATTARGSTA
jgi:hypothetical protein